MHIHTTENENNHFTVGLTCFANDQKLSPMIIFNSQRWSKTKSSTSSSVIVSFHAKGWMNKQ
ncbi:12366_t:CDS:1, partial [Cetraspora pellucida]